MRFRLTRRVCRGKISMWIKLCAPPRVPPRVKIRGIYFCGYDGIGRRVGFRFLCLWRVGSSPTIRTKSKKPRTRFEIRVRGFFVQRIPPAMQVVQKSYTYA